MEKMLCIVLLTTVLLAQEGEAKKAYHGTLLTVTRTMVNKNGVRLIYGKNSQYEFTFTCNVDNDSCKAPQVGGEYQLFDDSPLNVYKVSVASSPS